MVKFRGPVVLSLFALVTTFVLMTAVAVAQQPPDFESLQQLPSTTAPSPQYQRLTPFSIHANPDTFHTEPISPGTQAVAPATSAIGFALANVTSVPNFQSSFSSRGKTWPFTMIGTPPSGGANTVIPAKILA